MKRNELRTVVVLALLLLNVPLYALPTHHRKIDAEAGDGTAWQPEWMKALPDSLPVCKVSIPVRTTAAVSKEGTG